MKIIVTSDIHGHLPEIPPCDLLLIAGDIVPDDFSTGEGWKADAQEEWLRGAFTDWMCDLDVGEIVGIGGNHDKPFTVSNVGRELPWIYLNNESTQVFGLTIFGSPMSPKFGNWSFMLPDAALATYWDDIPKDVDILMVHGPPKGRLDRVWDLAYDPKKKDMVPIGYENVGSGTLRNKLDYEDYPNLKLVVFGHIHSCYGQTEQDGVVYVNASYVNEAYESANPPMEFAF